MGYINIILKKDVNSLGEEGDIKRVKRGYAFNYLLPQNLAVDCTLNNKNILEKQKDAIEKRRLQKAENANELKEKLEKVKIQIDIPAGDKGRLYGTVTNIAVAEAINEQGFDIDKKNIDIGEHIKHGGDFQIRVHIYHDIYAVVQLTVNPVFEEKKEVSQKGKRRRNSIEKFQAIGEENEEIKEEAVVEDTDNNFEDEAENDIDQDTSLDE